jgi:hypothetical protein
MYKYSRSSKKHLNTCDNQLVLLFNEVIKEIDCSIICGHRGRKEQEDAFNRGASKLHYPHSKHNKYPSMAVDVLPYPFNHDWNREQFEPLAEVVKRKAKELGIKIEWGGDWETIVDCPHWELC